MTHFKFSNKKKTGKRPTTGRKPESNSSKRPSSSTGGDKAKTYSGKPKSYSDRPISRADKPKRSFDKPARSSRTPRRKPEKFSQLDDNFSSRKPDFSERPASSRRDKAKKYFNRPKLYSDRPRTDKVQELEGYTKRRSKPTSRFGSRPDSRPSSNRNSGLRSKPKREIKKFDPSIFIKKAEGVTPTVAYIPKNTFNDFLINEQIKDNISRRGYKIPTKVQDEAIPVILEGRDVIASANTGTGKTAAFLIPLVNNILAGKINRVLILVPTRELAGQIQDELNIFKEETNISAALCIGGVNIDFQIKKLKNNPEFVIGTPGRLIDLEERRALSFGSFDAIVLDEVDSMLDMGFITDIKDVISKLPKKRHSLFFSATIPAKAKELMNSFLNNPVAIAVKTRESAENVNQDIIKVGSEDKIEILHDLLIKPEFKKVIIFARTKRSTDKLSKNLIERGFRVAAIHGDRSQAQRQRALNLFKDGQLQILLATDVVARGIDIDDVTHVINYDLPQTYEDYIHRIGRTGRAEKTGNAITFID